MITTELRLSQNYDYHRTIITTELWLPQNYDYHRTMITTELWLPQIYDYHRTIITTELWLPQNYNYHRTIITTELRLSQNYDYHRTIITTELRLPQNYDYHRTMITTFYRHVLMLDNSKTLGVLGELAKWRNVTVSLAMSVCLSVRPSVPPHGKKLALTGRIFMKFDIWRFFFENPSTKLKLHSSVQQWPVLCMKIDVHF